MDVYGLGYNIDLDEENDASLVSWLPELQSYGVGGISFVVKDDKTWFTLTLQ